MQCFSGSNAKKKKIHAVFVFFLNQCVCNYLFLAKDGICLCISFYFLLIQSFCIMCGSHSGHMIAGGQSPDHITTVKATHDTEAPLSRGKHNIIKQKPWLSAVGDNSVSVLEALVSMFSAQNLMPLWSFSEKKNHLHCMLFFFSWYRIKYTHTHTHTYITHLFRVGSLFYLIAYLQMPPRGCSKWLQQWRSCTA